MPNGPIVSPLRYPGGKAAIAPLIKNIIINHFPNEKPIYIEPFSGGAANAIFLGINDLVEQSIINDLDKSVYAFWYSILNHTEEFVKLIYDTPINYETWLKMKEIHSTKESQSLLTLGFATFFLNRTNRSGIITGGVLGGKDQSSKDKIDCRFNKYNLRKRIEKIALHREKFQIFNLDVFDLIDQVIAPLGERAFTYYDPPYYHKASELYENHFNHDNHVNLKNHISSINHNWIMTYDNCEEISLIYEKHTKTDLFLNYSVAEKRKGKEIIIVPEHNISYLQSIINF